MLTVVQDHQQRLVTDEAGQALGGGRGRAPRVPGLLAEAQGRDHDLGEQRRVADGGQLDQPHPIRKPTSHPPGQLHRHTRLARPTRPDHRHQPMQLHQLGQLPQLQLPADQAGEPLGQVVAALVRVGGGRLQGRVLDEHPLVEPLQLRRRVDPQLLSQHRPRLLIHPQGVGLTTRPVQRHHQQPTQPLPSRISRHQPLQLPHQPGLPTRPTGASRSSANDSSAARRSSSNRAASARAHGRSANSANAGPRHSPSASSRSRAASAPSPGRPGPGAPRTGPRPPTPAPPPADTPAGWSPPTPTHPAPTPAATPTPDPATYSPDDQAAHRPTGPRPADPPTPPDRHGPPDPPARPAP